MFEFLSYIAAPLYLVANIPQIHKLIKTKHSEDLSLDSYIISLIAGILNLTYSIESGDYRLILSNISYIIAMSWIIILITKYRK